MRPKEFDGVYWELLLRLATTLCVQENFSTTPGRSSSLSPVLLKITHVRTETVTVKLFGKEMLVNCQTFSIPGSDE